jgi:hypothetical protein
MTKSKNPESRLDDLAATCKLLEAIAASYPARSRKRKAVRDAAEALVFLTMHKQLKASYDRFRQSATRGLTRTQEQTLRSMAIKP